MTTTRAAPTARLLILLLAALGITHADVFTFSGTLDPAANLHLTNWDQYANAYTAPISGPGDDDRSFNIAVHNFPVLTAGTVTVASNGYGLGGFDAVVSVFAGTGNAAGYLDDRYSPLAPGDFSFALNLVPGFYTLAVTIFGSQPCGAGLCSAYTGTFGDGFTNLVNFDPSSPLPLFYAVEVTTPTAATVPEPGHVGLAVLAAIAVLGRKRFKR